MILSNGMVAMPAPPHHGILYNQMPDGTLIQMQPSPNMMPTIMTSQMPLIMNHPQGNGGQLIQGPNGGTLLLSPGQGGLLQMQQQQQGYSQQNFVTLSGQGTLMPGGQTLQQVSPNPAMTFNVGQTTPPNSRQNLSKISPILNSPKIKRKQLSRKRSRDKPVKPKQVELEEDSDSEPLYASNDEESESDDDDVIDFVKNVETFKKSVVQVRFNCHIPGVK